MIEVIAAPFTQEAPIENVTVFMAGGISNCWDWQSHYIKEFNELATKRFGEESSKITLYNPRRDYFDMRDEKNAVDQIEWEYERIQKSHIMSFWFPNDTLCPITLYELGRAAVVHDRVFVGCDTLYARKLDVVKQLNLARPDIQVVFDLDELIYKVVKSI